MNKATSLELAGRRYVCLTMQLQVDDRRALSASLLTHGVFYAPFC